MNYNEFVSAIKNEIEHLVGRDMRVELHTTMKNNGRERIGLALREEGINVAPAIYLEEYYSMWKEGKSIKKIAYDIMKLYRRVRVCQPWDAHEYCKYESVRDKVACKLINYEKNKELLRDTPHIQYLDLAIVFYLLVDVVEYETTTMLIKCTHKEMWQVTLEELYQDAMENAELLLPSCFQTMSSVIHELIEDDIAMDGYEEYEVASREERMYVLSNRERSFGAACILNKKKLEMIGDLLDENFYILPSSIHEVIIIPVSKAPERQEIDEMIDEINRTQVIEEEVLSSHCYYYERKRRMLLY